MDPFNRDNSSKLEKLQKKLYSPREDFSIRQRRPMSDPSPKIRNDWGGEKEIDEELKESYKNPSKFNAFKVVFLLAFFFFLASLVYGGYVFLKGVQSVSGSDVDITVIGPVQVSGGEELSLDIIVENNNQIPLQNVELIIKYPKGTKETDNLKEDMNTARESLGTIQPNSVVKKTKKSVMFGEEGENKEIEVMIEYNVPESQALFEKIKKYDLTLKSSPIKIRVNNIKEISSNQEITFDVEVISNTDKELDNVLVKVDYPFGFTFINSSLEPIDDSMWLIKKLEPNKTEEFEIKGKLEGQNNEERIFRFETGLADSLNRSKMEVVFTSLLRSVTIKKSFFGLDIEFGQDKGNEIIREAGQSLSATVKYNNNLTEPILNAKIEIKVAGNAFDNRNITPSSGHFRSTDNTLIWSANTDSRFKEILPQRSGTVGFSVIPKDVKGIGNPVITFEATVTGNRVNEDNVEEEIRSTVFKTVKYSSKVDTSAVSLFGTGPITNTGPVPPRVNQETTYTVKFDSLNTSNDLSNARFSTTLPEYVEWTGEVSGSGEFNYDKVTKTVVWDIGNIKAGAGYSLPNKSGYFQVKVVPSTTHTGSTLQLTTDVNFSAQDTFTKSTIKHSLRPVTNTTLDGRDGNVVE